MSIKKPVKRIFDVPSSDENVYMNIQALEWGLNDNEFKVGATVNIYEFVEPKKIRRSAVVLE